MVTASYDYKGRGTLAVGVPASLFESHRATALP